MSEAPYQVYKKINLDLPSSYMRRHSQPASYYYNQSENEIKPIYHSFQPQLQQKKIFGFEIFVSNQILNQRQPVEKWFCEMMQENNVESIKFNTDLNIPDLNGRNIQIFDHDMQKKYLCCKNMLHDVFDTFRKIKKQLFSIIIFVPEGMVSLLIGTKGHQINKIMRQSYTKIVVNQPINRMTYRTAKITGQYGDIAKACKMIYEILQQKSAIAYAIQKEPSQFDYTKSKIRTKFLFAYPVIRYLQKKKKGFLQKIQQQTKCSVNYEVDRKNQLIKDDQQIVVISGRLQDVQALIVMLVNICHNILSEDRKNIDYTIKLLIPVNYVTKLIGQKGYMIKDIIQRSGGAQIKILSDREAQRDTKQCIIAINGTIQNKIDASCFILEQIQCFKNGGPILQSGKSINQNLVQQFKNSIPLHNQEQPKLLHFTSECAEIENINQNSQIITNSVTNLALSPIQKPSLISQKYNKEGDKSEQQGLIEGQSSEVQEKKKEQISQKSSKKKKYYSSENPSSSKSRSRSKRKSKRQESKRKKRVNSKSKSKSPSKSKSSSLEFKHDRQYVEVKMIVPRKLADDYRQLEYIQSIGKSKIIVLDQKIQGYGEAIITIKGCLKDNCKSIKLIQKRIGRYRN